MADKPNENVAHGKAPEAPKFTAETSTEEENAAYRKAMQELRKAAPVMGEQATPEAVAEQKNYINKNMMGFTNVIDHAIQSEKDGYEARMQIAGKALQSLDIGLRDNEISFAEVRAISEETRKKVYAALNTNGDGKVSDEEIAAARKALDKADVKMSEEVTTALLETLNKVHSPQPVQDPAKNR